MCKINSILANMSYNMLIMNNKAKFPHINNKRMIKCTLNKLSSLKSGNNNLRLLQTWLLKFQPSSKRPMSSPANKLLSCLKPNKHTSRLMNIMNIMSNKNITMNKIIDNNKKITINNKHHNIKMTTTIITVMSNLYQV